MPQPSSLKAPRTKVVIAIVMGLGLLLALGGQGLMDWARSALHVLGICLAFLVTVNSLEQGLEPGSRTLLLVCLALLAVIGGAHFALDPIVAIYTAGFAFFCVFLVLFLAQPAAAISLGGWLKVCLLIALVLGFSPTTISRIVIHLDHLAVPSKFALKGDPSNRHPHNTSRGYPHHLLVPLGVTLSANNIRLHETPPVLELTPRRDTEFPINAIDYKFLHLPLATFSGPALHTLQFATDEEAITLVKRPRGITVTDINGDEVAKLRLPTLDPGTVSTGSHIRAILLKLLLWGLVCLSFWSWAIRPAVHSARQKSAGAT